MQDLEHKNHIHTKNKHTQSHHLPSYKHTQYRQQQHLEGASHGRHSTPAHSIYARALKPAHVLFVSKFVALRAKTWMMQRRRRRWPVLAVLVCNQLVCLHPVAALPAHGGRDAPALRPPALLLRGVQGKEGEFACSPFFLPLPVSCDLRS